MTPDDVVAPLVVAPLDVVAPLVVVLGIHVVLELLTADDEIVDEGAIPVVVEPAEGPVPTVLAAEDDIPGPPPVPAVAGRPPSMSSLPNVMLPPQATK